MIQLNDVYKQYLTNRVSGKWVLEGVTLNIPAHTSVGVVGGRGAGKSTLLRIISGVERPTKGEVVRNARISSPARYTHSFQPMLTGRQNAKFIFRINGFVDDLKERLAMVEAHMKPDGNFDKPVKSYKPQQKQTLSFALSLALGFDLYLSDGFNFFTQPELRAKSTADNVLKSIAERASLIMVMPPTLNDQLLKKYCSAGIWIHEGRVEWFDDINAALVANREYTQRQRPVPEKAKSKTNPAVDGPILEKINSLQYTLRVLNAGLRGRPELISVQILQPVVNKAKQVGLRLVASDQLEAQGYKVKEGMMPILKSGGKGGAIIEYFDLGTQCQKLDPA